MFTEIFEFLQKGGYLMIPIAICSVLSLAVIIEKIINLRNKKIIVPEVKSVVNSLTSEDDINLALSVCDQHKGVLSNLMKMVLEHKGTSYLAVRD